MPYNKELSRAYPGYIVILIDQSGSMCEAFGTGGTKAEECAKAVNRVLRETVLACTDGERLKNSCEFSIISYGSSGNAATNAFSGSLASKPVVTIQELSENYLRIETVNRKVPDGAGGLVEIQDEFPIWIEPAAVGGTPMTEAFEMAYELVDDWTKSHSLSFPPVAINITDGEANFHYSAKTAASKLAQQRTDDGSTLVLNAHISGDTAPQVVLPSLHSQLPPRDSNAEFLFNISSALPPVMIERALAAGWTPTTGARGFVYNAKIETMIQLLEIGTKAEFLR